MYEYMITQKTITNLSAGRQVDNYESLIIKQKTLSIHTASSKYLPPYSVLPEIALF